MIRTISFAALSAAVVFGGASGAVAASKKGHEAFASAASTAVDPRDAYLAKRKGNNTLQTSCDVDPACNGWGEWLRLVEAGKLKP